MPANDVLIANCRSFTHRNVLRLTSMHQTRSLSTTSARRRSKRVLGLLPEEETKETQFVPLSLFGKTFLEHL